MWDKSFRFSLFAGIYEALFWEEQESHGTNSIDWSIITAQLGHAETQPSVTLLQACLDTFLANQTSYTQILKKHLNSWNKTYLIVRACLYCFLTEKDYLQRNNVAYDESKLVGRYLRLSEDLIGGQNVALVHAVISKLVTTS